MQFCTHGSRDRCALNSTHQSLWRLKLEPSNFRKGCRIWCDTGHSCGTMMDDIQISCQTWQNSGLVNHRTRAIWNHCQNTIHHARQTLTPPPRSGVFVAPYPAPPTYSWEMPALRTAVEMAFTAVQIAVMSCVRSPVALGCLRCSANTNRVSVMQSVSMPAPVLVMVKFRKQLTNNCLSSRFGCLWHPLHSARHLGSRSPGIPANQDASFGHVGDTPPSDTSPKVPFWIDRENYPPRE